MDCKNNNYADEPKIDLSKIIVHVIQTEHEKQ